MMVDIIRYEERYLKDVVDVILPIQQKEFNVPITLEDQPDLLDIPGFYQKGVGNFWIACENSEVVGTVALVDIGESIAALRKMFVKASFRGAEKGVASSLLNMAIWWCRERGISDIYLGTTDKFIAAHRFYEKRGFLEIDKNELPASFPLMSVDSKFYRYTLR